MLRDDAIKTLQQARDEYHDKLIEQEEMLESLNEDVEKLRADIQERKEQVLCSVYSSFVHHVISSSYSEVTICHLTCVFS